MVCRLAVCLVKIWWGPKTLRLIAVVKGMALLVTRVSALFAVPTARSMTAKAAGHAILQRLQAAQMARF